MHNMARIEYLTLMIPMGIGALLSLLSMIYPHRASEYVARYFEWWIKVYGYEVTIQSTKKSEQVFRVWNGAFFIIFISLLIYLR